MSHCYTTMNALISSKALMKTSKSRTLLRKTNGKDLALTTSCASIHWFWGQSWSTSITKIEMRGPKSSMSCSKTRITKSRSCMLEARDRARRNNFLQGLEARVRASYLKQLKRWLSRGGDQLNQMLRAHPKIFRKAVHKRWPNRGTRRKIDILIELLILVDS